LAVAALAPSAAAHAATQHALILAVGDYGTGDPADNLPGIDQDARTARQIALRLGVPEENIRSLSDAQVTRAGLVNALADLERRVGANDSVFLYFSGHGDRFTHPSTGRCTEALMLRGLEAFTDEELQAALQRLNTRAREVVMFNDSCFSGGAAEKSAVHRGAGGAAVKQLPGQARIKVDGREISRDPCRVAVNDLFRQFKLRSDATGRAPHQVYVAAAAENEVAFATPNGSAATVAWAQCLSDPGTDTDRSGAITARELNACGQARLQQTGRQQTLVARGQADLPLLHLSGNVPVVTQEVFADVVAAADPSIRVQLQFVEPRTSYRVGQDSFKLNISTDRGGYLYVYQAGSDGDLSLLFPTDTAANTHFLPAGNHVLPRTAGRAYVSMGPEGTSHFIAVLTPTPLPDLTDGARRGKPLQAHIAKFARRAKSSADAGYGASAVLSAQEVR
jgi:hypothetical protein